MKKNNHTFHIPVMGTGFTIDTPIKVARFGINSVIAIADDRLIEKVRKHYCNLYKEDYIPIKIDEEDARARRVTAYLNLVERIVTRQIETLRKAPFELESEITKYFELLDDASSLKQDYHRMMKTQNPEEKSRLETRLREQVSPGSIDINIMTKVDRINFKDGKVLPQEYSDAMAGLRGYAKSNLDSSLIFSAGLNLHLFSYIESFPDFFPDEKGNVKKRIILKVSDFRSAQIQGKVLAKKGVWISEFRVESGLNCGGHAFATTGYLFGPVLEEFKQRKIELFQYLSDFYKKALQTKTGVEPLVPPEIQISAQGGIGTQEEDHFLIKHYELKGTGWGTPFLLVPEATTVDEDTLEKLAGATEEDLVLTNASPLGVMFNSLKTSTSEAERLKRIADGKPGSPCINKYLQFNTEFGPAPLCVASSQYQKKKIEQIKSQDLSPSMFKKAHDSVVEKACICRDLGNGVMSKYKLSDSKHKEGSAICPGPGLAFFSHIVSLKYMVGHIYGKVNILNTLRERPNMFINELKLYVQHLQKVVAEALPQVSPKKVKYFDEFQKNLLEGIEYYKKLASDFIEETEQHRQKFSEDLLGLKDEVERFVSSNSIAFKIS
jgi:hypothetical protein